MGKPTKAQMERQIKAKPETVDPDRGVYVVRMRDVDKPDGDKKLMAFKGEFECQMTPQGALAIVEMVPDVANANKGLPIPKIRRFIADGVWAEVLIK